MLKGAEMTRLEELRRQPNQQTFNIELKNMLSQCCSSHLLCHVYIQSKHTLHGHSISTKNVGAH